MIEKNGKRPTVVGDFIRKRREALKLSQRALGKLFDPPVTTQFVSNVERGVTPLPPIHIPLLAKALTVSEVEIRVLLEKEYSAKLVDKFGKLELGDGTGADTMPSLMVANGDYEFMRNLYDAYQTADSNTKQAFRTVCQSILKMASRSEIPQQ